MSTDLNPYAPPQAAVADISEAPSEAEAIRREHIKHEASIRSVGILYYLSGGLMALIAAMFVAGLTDIYFGIGLAVVYGALAALSIVVGHQIRALRPWARIAAIVLSVIGLFGFPLGTLINGYILYLLLSKKDSASSRPTTQTSSPPRRTSSTRPQSCSGSFSASCSCWSSQPCSHRSWWGSWARRRGHWQLTGKSSTRCSYEELPVGPVASCPSSSLRHFVARHLASRVDKIPHHPGGSCGTTALFSSGSP